MQKKSRRSPGIEPGSPGRESRVQRVRLSRTPMSDSLKVVYKKIVLARAVESGGGYPAGTCAIPAGSVTQEVTCAKETHGKRYRAEDETEARAYRRRSVVTIEIFQLLKIKNEMEKKSLENDAESFLTLLDLMCEVWEASFSATRNIRLLIAMISSYTAKVQSDARRMCEGHAMKRILMDTYSLWVQKGPMDAICTKHEMLTFVRSIASKELHAQLVKGIMNSETFNEWVDEYQRYVGTLETDSAIAEVSDNKVEEEEEEEERDEGMDSLFELVPMQDGEPIPQNLTKVQNGKLNIIKTPGEIGSHVVRLQAYDVEDIKGMEKRNWWKRAKLRAQILYSPTKKNDRKYQALRQLLDAAAMDLQSVPGVVRERRDLFHSEDAYPARVNRKRKA